MGKMRFLNTLHLVRSEFKIAKPNHFGLGARNQREIDKQYRLRLFFPVEDDP